VTAEPITNASNKFDATGHSRGRRAASKAQHRNSLHVTVPVLGRVALPPPEQLAYLGGLGTLAVVGLLEWPVAAVLGVGHLLAADRNNKIIADFGEALEEV
jgi:hypothetical protein